MAESVNQQITDALVHRQLRASRVEARWRRDLWQALAVLEADILAALKAADPTDFALLTRRRREVDRLLDATLSPLVLAWYAQTARRLDGLLGQLAIQEAGAVQTVVNTAAEAAVITEVPPEAGLSRRVATALIPSASRPTDLSTTGADWWQRQGEGVVHRLGDTLMVGVSLEESLTQLTARVRGTADQGLQDGVMGKARQDATRLLTTQVTNALSEARMAVGDRNAARLIAVHTSILDRRTSMICLGRHGVRYTLPDHEPLGHRLPYLNGPPYHANCRSVMTLALARGGPVAQETTTQWLRRQGAAVQDDVLGPTRAALFRAGKLTPRQLLAATSGRPLTLEELEA